ncbi:MAG: EAL domain-containing protein, partial [Pseudolabrys sp.]|nr:EAL domain-containing protein [Pseudolabrys sp.]
MLAGTRPHATEEQRYTSWDRARLSVVVPVGVIVAVAIVCIVVAVLSSAQRADDNSIEQESQVLTRALNNKATRVLRQVASAATSETAVHSIRTQFDSGWVHQRIGLWLQNFFEHDYVAVLDGGNRVLYSAFENHAASPARFEALRPEIDPLIRTLRGENVQLQGAVEVEMPSLSNGASAQAALIQSLMGRPAIVAGVTVPVDANTVQASAADAPIVIAIRFIDRDVLTDLASQLRLDHLRIPSDEPVPAGDHLFVFHDPNGHAIARFAWTPKQPGAEIVNNVVPFIAVALAGFALLAAFVLAYMRRTASAIAVGESRLRHLAMHDPLCGLPNRIYFGERLEAVIDEVKHGGAPAAVFYIDLDHFKEVNDTLGHPAGDELIRAVTLRLSRVLRDNDLVARLGGDEFAVISDIGFDQAKTMDIAQRIISSLSAPYSINKQSIVIGASIGIAIIDQNSGGAADLMRYADMALYRAKNEGRNRACVYDTVMDADLSSRKLLESDLRHALETDQLQLLYQPLVNNSGEKVIGVEALCRWTHPQRGNIPPSEFIPVAEHSGLIIELGEWVLRRACTDGKNWPGITVAANVSPLQFRRADFVSTVERILQETGFDPARLELELTESTLIGNIETAEAAMHKLKALGVRLALDDFGTGYSSLLYLRRFPFDKLKIDRSFVNSIEKGSDAAAIVHAIVSLGRGLGMKVTAEGVETADQQLFLRAAGVHSMQGYRFGKAVSTDDISARVQSPTPPKLSP